MRHLHDRVSALVDGELAPTDEASALAHLARCPDCSAAVEVESRVKAAVSSVEASAPLAPSGELVERLRAMGGPAGPLRPRDGHLPGTPRAPALPGPAGPARPLLLRSRTIFPLAGRRERGRATSGRVDEGRRVNTVGVGVLGVGVLGVGVLGVGVLGIGVLGGMGSGPPLPGSPQPATARVVLERVGPTVPAVTVDPVVRRAIPEAAPSLATLP